MQELEGVKKSFDLGLPPRGSDSDDRYAVMNMQMKKLEEMRKRQMSFFDSKITELQDQHVELDVKLNKLEARETSIKEKERQLVEQMKRIELEKSELIQIKNLLRIENESIILSSADLNSQIQKYEALIKLVARTGVVTRPDALN